MKKVLKKLLGVPVIFAAGALSGCATILSGTSDKVRIDSLPRGAKVVFNGKFVGYTPIKLEMDRDTHPLIVLSHEGYENTRVQIDWAMNPVFLITSPLFYPTFFTNIIVDVRSGAACRYSENDIIVPLLLDDETKLELYDGDVVLTKFEN